MKKVIFKVIGLALLSASAVYAYSEGDFQVWNTDVQELKLNKDLKVTAEEEFRWGRDASEFYYHHYDGGLLYNINKYVNVGAGYRQIYELKKGKFMPEYAPYVTATLSWDLAGFKFDDRNRFEYRFFDYQDANWRYRNKATIKLPWKFTALEIQPFISDEIFVQIDDDNVRFNQNRFSTGLGFSLTKNIKAEVYYMFQSSKSKSKWTDSNVLGTKLKMVF